MTAPIETMRETIGTICLICFMTISPSSAHRTFGQNRSTAAGGGWYHAPGKMVNAKALPRAGAVADEMVETLTYGHHAYADGTVIAVSEIPAVQSSDTKPRHLLLL